MLLVSKTGTSKKQPGRLSWLITTLQHLKDTSVNPLQYGSILGYDFSISKHTLF